MVRFRESSRVMNAQYSRVDYIQSEVEQKLAYYKVYMTDSCHLSMLF